MAAQVVTTPSAAPSPTHAEAPASATVKAVDPAGYEWLLTVRSDSARELVDRAAVLSTWLADHGWQPATRAARAQAAPTDDTGELPICPYHNKAMTRRSKDGRSWWSCSEKLSNGEWCQYRPKDRR